LSTVSCFISHFNILVAMLEDEPDFKLQKPLLVEAVEAVGGKVLFGTKYHPELMPIENSYRFDFIFLICCRQVSCFIFGPSK
jgi:hypothetical protein